MYTVIFVTVQYLSHVYAMVLNFNLEFLSSVNDETSFRGNISDVNEPQGVFVFSRLYSVRYEFDFNSWQIWCSVLA